MLIGRVIQNLPIRDTSGTEKPTGSASGLYQVINCGGRGGGGGGREGTLSLVKAQIDFLNRFFKLLINITPGEKKGEAL